MADFVPIWFMILFVVAITFMFLSMLFILHCKTPLNDQISTLNHIFAQNDVFLEVYGMFDEKCGEILSGSRQTYIQRGFKIYKQKHFLPSSSIFII